MEKRLLSVKEAAGYLGLAPQSIYNQLHERRFPIKFVRLGKLIKFDIKDLDEYIDSLPKHVRNKGEIEKIDNSVTLWKKIC